MAKGVKYQSESSTSVKAKTTNTTYKPGEQRGETSRKCDPIKGYQSGQSPTKGATKLESHGKKFGEREK